IVVSANNDVKLSHVRMFSGRRSPTPGDFKVILMERDPYPGSTGNSGLSFFALRSATVGRFPSTQHGIVACKTGEIPFKSHIRSPPPSEGKPRIYGEHSPTG